jgi:hypothetical protein
MRRVVRVLPLLVVLAIPVQADVTVRMTAAGRVDIAARSAPLSEILGHLARQSGMRVLYDGPEPRQLVTVSLSGRWPAEAVKELLGAQSVNYALAADAAGTGVRMLVVFAGSPEPRAQAARPARGRSRSATPPPPNDDVVEALLRLIRPPRHESEAEERSHPPEAEPAGIPPALLDLGLSPPDTVRDATPPE